MRWHDHIDLNPAFPPKSSDATYLSFTSELWESAPPLEPGDEVELEGTVAVRAAHWSVRHGVELGTKWTAPVTLRLDDGQLITLLLDEAVVTGGRHWFWKEPWEDFCQSEPEISATLEAPPPGALVSVDAWLLEAGDRVVVRGVPTEVTRTGGYRDRACTPGLRVRVAFSRAEPEPPTRPHTVWRAEPPSRFRRVLRRAGAEAGFWAAFFLIGLIALGLHMALGLGFVALLVALGF